MLPTDVNAADLDQVVTVLRAAGLRSVSYEPEDITTFPGAWLLFPGFHPAEQLGSTTLHLVVHLVVPDNGAARSRLALLELFNQVQPALVALGAIEDQVRFIGLTLPASTRPLPALAVPLSVITLQEEPAP